MKSKFLLFSLLATALLVVTGCTETPEPTPPTPPVGEDFSLTISTSNIQSNSATITTNPSSITQTHFTSYLTKDEYSAAVSGSDMSNYITTLISKMATDAGKSPSEFLAEVLSKGNSNLTAQPLLPSTTYVAFATGLNVDGALVGKFATKEFTTLSEDALALTIEVGGITTNSAEVTTTASMEDRYYYTDVISALELDGIGGTDKLIDFATTRLYEMGGGGDLSEVVKANAQMGTTTLNIEELAPNLGYFAYSFGIELNGEVTTSLIISKEFKTLKGATFTYSDISSQSNVVKYSVTPSDNNESYFTYIVPKSLRDTLTSDYYLYQDAIEILNGLTPNGEGQADRYADHLSTGASTQSIDNNEDLVYIFTIGITANGTITSGVSWSEAIATSNTPIQTFTFDISNVTSTTVLVKVTPSIADQSYATVIIPQSEYETLSSSEVIAYIKSNVTSSDLVEGETTTSHTKLAKNTDYRVVAVGLDSELSETSELYPSEIFTTTIDQRIVITIVSVTDKHVRYSASGNDADQRYYTTILTTAKLNELGSDEAVNNYLQDELMAQYGSLSGDAKLTEFNELTASGGSAGRLYIQPTTTYKLVIVNVNFEEKINSVLYYSEEITTAAEQVVSLTIDEITSNSVTVTGTVSGYNGPYYTVALTTAELTALGSDEAINDYLQEQLFNIYDPLPLLFKESKFNALTSEHNDQKTIEIQPNTDYKVVAVGVYYRYMIDSEVFYTEEFKSPDAALSNIAIEIADVTSQSVAIKTTVDHTTARYYINVFKNSDYDAMIAGNSLNASIEYHVNQQITNQGGSVESAVNSITVAGNIDKTFSGLTLDTDYRVFAVGLNSDGTLSTDVFVSDKFTTDGYSNSISINVNSYTSYNVDARITPSSSSMRYFTIVISDQYTDDQIQSAIMSTINSELSSASNKESRFNELTFTGTLDRMLSTALEPNKAYRVYGLGVQYSSGAVSAVSSLAKSSSFTTRGGLTTSSSLVNAGETSLTFNIDASNIYDTYLTALVTEEYYNSVSGNTTNITNAVLQFHAVSTSGMTNEEKEEYYADHLISGDKTQTVSDLSENSTYRLVVIGVNPIGYLTPAGTTISNPYSTFSYPTYNFNITYEYLTVGEVIVNVVPQGHNNRYYTSLVEASVLAANGGIGSRELELHLLEALEELHATPAYSHMSRTEFYTEMTEVGTTRLGYNVTLGTNYDAIVMGLDTNGNQTSKLVSSDRGITPTNNSPIFEREAPINPRNSSNNSVQEIIPIKAR